MADLPASAPPSDRPRGAYARAASGSADAAKREELARTAAMPARDRARLALRLGRRLTRWVKRP